MTTLEDVGRGSWRGRAPVVIGSAVLLVTLGSLPFRAVVLPEVPGFLSLCLAVVISFDLLTAVLLISQYRAGGSPRLLALSWAFLWSAGITALLAVAIPGVLMTSPSFGADPNVILWLWVGRYAVTPVVVAVALMPWPGAVERRIASVRHRSRLVALDVLVVTVGVTAIGLLVGLAPGALPSLQPEPGSLQLDATGVWGMCAFAALTVVLAAWGVWRRGTWHTLEAWAVVAAVAFFGDVVTSVAHQEPNTVTYYASRLLAVAAASIVTLAVLRDTGRQHTETTEVAQQLEEENAELLEAQRLRDHLTAVVSHDMRTPLAGLQGYLELLRDDDLDTDLARRMLERSWTLTRRLTLLTEDLLAAATLTHGSLVVMPEPVSLDQQLGETASCFPDLDLELDCPPGLTAYADPLRLQQVLGNLVRNAQKHGAEPVLIAAASDPTDPGGVLVRVSDAGPGVPATFVPRLFDRYTQGSVTATGGSGLGLSVVRDLVAAHGGTIRYDAVDNAFEFTLPGAVASAPVEVSAASDPAGSPRRAAGARTA